MIPIVKNFRATNLSKAFFLNALVSASIVVFAIELRRALEDEHNEIYGYFNRLYGTKQLSEWQIITIVFPATFVASIVVYLFMYLIFEYGGNFIISNKKRLSW
jgi:hypothetical protein|tara:strand:- start:833 stop:1141 length:309 start_codon:yes stop_codon:yes gene_type:complete